MELCTARAVSNVPIGKLCVPNLPQFRWKTSLPFKKISASRTNLGLLYHTNSSLRSTSSEDISTVVSQYVKEESDAAIKSTSEETSSQYVKEEPDAAIATDAPTQDSPKDEESQPSEFLDKLNIEFDSEDTYSLLLFSGGALVALYLATAIVGAVDSIPLFPKLMEVVGLGYTLWFTTRYLLFKENRKELFAKVEEIKQQVLGSKDD